MFYYYSGKARPIDQKTTATENTVLTQSVQEEEAQHTSGSHMGKYQGQLGGEMWARTFAVLSRKGTDEVR